MILRVRTIPYELLKKINTYISYPCDGVNMQVKKVLHESKTKLFYECFFFVMWLRKNEAKVNYYDYPPN